MTRIMITLMMIMMMSMMMSMMIHLFKSLLIQRWQIETVQYITTDFQTLAI